MPYYGDGAPYYYGGSYANHSSITSSVGRYYSPIAARYSPHLSTISESPSYVVRRRHGPTSSSASSGVPFARPRRIIDTADIDVTKPPRRYGQDSSQQQQQQRHRLRRDRPTIKIRSQALKDNPALREYNEKHEKTVGELLVEKFLIKDKQEQQSRQQAAEQRRMRLYHQASLLRPESSPPISKDEDEDLLAAMRRRVTRRMTRRRSSADVIPLNPEQIEREAALLAAQAEALDTLVAEEQAEIEVEVRRGTFAKRQAMRLPSEISELSETEQEDEDPRSSSHRHAAKKKRRKRSEQLVVSSADSDEEEDDDEIVLEIPESVIEEEEEEFEWDDRHKCDDLRDIVPSNGEVIIKVNDVIAAKSKERMAADTEGLTSQPRKTHESNGFGEADVKLAVNDITSDVKVEPPKRKISLEIIDAKIQETQRELKDLICKEKRFPELKRREKMLKLDETDKKEVKAATGSTVPLTGGRGKADNSETVEPLVDKSAAVKEAKDASKVVAATRDDVVTKDEATTKREKNEIATKVKKDETTMKIDKDETTTNDKNEATRKLDKDELATREKNDEAARKEKKSESTAKEKKSESPAKVKKDEKKTSKAKEKTKSSEGDGKLKPKADRSLKRTKSAPQADLGTEKELVPRFKIEACNSVGDFSTLYVKAAAASPEAVPVRTIEQFRESIRLPAPRIDVELPLSKSNSSVDAAVVLPARKPYVLDTTRNSVYLALRQPPSPGGDGRPVGAPSAQDQSIVAPSADTRKESTERTIASPRPANCVENRSIIESPEAVISAKQRAELISDAGAKPSDKSQIGEKSARVKAPAREEFVAWWDETPEHKATPAQGKKAVEKKPEDKVAPAQENKAVEKKPEDKVAPAQEKKVIEKKLEDKVDKSKKNAESVKPEDDRLKAKGQTATDEKTGASKTEKAVVDLVDVKVKTGLGETKEKTADKKDKAIDESKEIKQTVEKSKSPDIKKKPADVKPSDKPVTPGKEVAASVAQEIKSTVDETKPKASAAHKPAEAKEPKPSKTDVPVIESKEKPDKSPDKKEKAAKVSSKPQPPSKPVAAAANEQEEKKAQQPRPKLSSEKERAGEAASPEGAPSRAPSRDKSALSGRPEKKQPRSESPRLERQPLANIPEEPAVSPPADSGPISLVKRDERKRRVDAAAVMKIEKRILEESDSPHGIRSGAMPESQIIELARKREEAEAAAAAAAAAQNADAEIDFWSEIKAPRQSVKLPVAQEARKHSLRLDLDRISAPGAGEEEPATPLAPDQLDETTPLISEPATPLRENLAEVPLTNLKLSGMLPRDEEDEELERTGTVKKMSKWSNRDNLSNLNDVDGEVTPVASKEVSPQVSLSSTTKKKKIVKKKKSVTAGSKKKGSEKAESKPGTAKGSKLLGGKRQPGATAAASPQTSLLRAPLSAAGSPRNSPSQRPADLNKLFYTTPAILLTATPRDLRKVRRAKVKRKKPPTRTPSLSSDSTGSTRSTATNSTEEGSNCEEDAEHKRLASTRSNDSGFDGSPRLSTPSQSSENQRNAESEHFHHSGRITPPATNLPRFKKYEVTDFNFLKVLGKGSFGKVLLAELRGTECVYAVKCLKKDVVLEDDDVECTLIERKVLTLATRHPYLCHLFCTFQTESHLFFVMEYLNGGDLMFHIQKSGRFSETRARFYAAEIWSGLIFLHKKGIVYRDLKLDNVLLDFEGHIRIADFGMCKLQIFLDRTADTFCGTPDYMAPEIIKGLKYNQAVDWWSYGVLLYEMLTGQSPFSGCDEDELFWSICNERPFIPRYLGQSSTELLVCLLEKDAGKRIPGHEIACHSFFSTIAWDKLERRTLEPPFKPAVEHTLDTRYFDTAFTTERPRLTPVPNQILTSMDQSVFRGFSYTNPNATD